jgi:hypothetical protein
VRDGIGQSVLFLKKQVILCTILVVVFRHSHQQDLKLMKNRYNILLLYIGNNLYYCKCAFALKMRRGGGGGGGTMGV